MASSGGFRLKVVGTRALKGQLGVDKNGNTVAVGGQFVEWGTQLAKGSDKARKDLLPAAADQLRRALAKAAPVFSSPYMDIEHKGTYTHLGLNKVGNWKKTNFGEQIGATGYGVEIYTDLMTRTGKPPRYLLPLVLFGVKEDRTETVSGAAALVFPDRQVTGPPARGKTHKKDAHAGLTGALVTHPRAYRGKRFDLVAEKNVMPEIKARLQKSAMRAVMEALQS